MTRSPRNPFLTRVLARRPARLAAAVLLLACFLPSPLLAGPPVPWPDWPALATRYPDAGAICLLDETDVRLEYLGGDTYGKRVLVHRVIAVLDPARSKDLLNCTLADFDGHRLARVSARTWTGPDRSVEVRKNQMFRVTPFSEFVLFRDIEGRRFAFPSVAPHTLLDLDYEYTSPWSFALEHVFAHYVPTLLSRARITIPGDFLPSGGRLNYRGRGIGEPVRNVVPTRRGDAVELSWELRDLPAVAREPQMPPIDEVAPRVRLALPPGQEYDSWAKLGKYYYREFFASRLEVTPEIQELADRLTAGLAAPEDRARALYDFVRGQVRYVAIEIGRGAFAPHRARDVLQMRYGDCKDKVCLLLSLFQAAGVPGRPALVRSAPLADADTALFSLGQFDHMIAWLPLGEKGWWLDPTAGMCPSTYLPADDQSRRALVLDPERGRFLTTAAYPAGANRVDWSLDAELAPDGTLSGKLELSATGAPAESYRAEYRAGDAGERRAMVARLLEERLPGARLDDVRVAALDSLEQPFVLTCSVQRPGAAVRAETALVLPGDFIAPPLPRDLLRVALRENPLLLGPLEHEQQRIRLRLPQGFTAQYRAGAVLNGQFFTYRETPGYDAGTVRLDRTYETRMLAIAPVDYPRARAEAEAVRKAWAVPLRFSDLR